MHWFQPSRACAVSWNAVVEIRWHLRLCFRFTPCSSKRDLGAKSHVKKRVLLGRIVRPGGGSDGSLTMVPFELDSVI